MPPDRSHTVIDLTNPRVLELDEIREHVWAAAQDAHKALVAAINASKDAGPLAQLAVSAAQGSYDTVYRLYCDLGERIDDLSHRAAIEAAKRTAEEAGIPHCTVYGHTAPAEHACVEG